MTFLSLNFLGSLVILINDKPVIGLRSAKVEALLAYLVVEQKRPLRRDALIGLLWPEEPLDVARANLRQSLSRLQKGVGNKQVSPPFLLVTRETVQFNSASSYQLDMGQFQQLLAACPLHGGQPDELCEQCVANWQTAVSHYKGDFLAHFFIDDSPPFEQWLLTVREALHQQALTALQWLADLHEKRGEYDQAIRYTQQQIGLEPWREEPYRQQMRLLARRGERTAALSLYDIYRRILAQELNVAPTAEMEQLFRRIQTFPANRPHNLHPSSGSFVGREAETAQLLHYLARPERRLVTLLGPGGVGKTRLSLHVAERLAREYLGPFAMGVYQVPLAASDTRQQLVQAIAHAVGVSLRGAEEPLAQLVAGLVDKELLLLLDNFEQLVSTGAEVVAAILAGTTAVKCLVTSRERLNLRQEWCINVEGLAYPQGVEGETAVFATPDSLNPQAYHAMQLFIERARQNQPDLGASWEERVAIGRICQLCVGVPLALELAAAWVGTLTCSEIAAEISKSLDILQADYHDLEPRQRSLRAVFDHSWQLLMAEEQQMLARLSVFHGSFSREAVGRVVGGEITAVLRLVTKSLLQTEAKRFQLHPLVRQFAAEKLQGFGQQAHFQQAHAHYYGSLVDAQKGLWSSKQSQQAVALIRQDIQNIRQGLLWSAMQRQPMLIDLYLHGLLNFYALANWYVEGQQAFELCATHLADANRLPGQAAEATTAVTYAKALSRQAAFQVRLGRFHQAIAAAEQAAPVLQQAKVLVEASFAFEVAGVAYYHLGLFTKAQQALVQSYVAAQQTDDQSRKANLGLQLGQVYHALGNDLEAEQWYRDSLVVYRAMNQQWGVGQACYGLGVVLAARGEQAQTFLQEALALFEEIGDQRGVALCLNQLGLLAQRVARLEEAKGLFQQSLQLFEQNGESLGVAQTLGYLGDVAGLTGAYEEAKLHLADSLEQSLALSAVPVALQALTSTAALLLAGAEPVLLVDGDIEGKETAVSSPAQTTSYAQAFQLLALVANHPASHQQTRHRAQTQLQTLRSRLPAEQLEQLQQQAEQQTLAEAVAGILTKPV